MKYIKLTRGHKTKVDNEDFEKLNKYKWYAYIRKNKKFVYAVRISKSKKMENVQVSLCIKLL